MAIAVANNGNVYYKAGNGAYFFFSVLGLVLSTIFFTVYFLNLNRIRGLNKILWELLVSAYLFNYKMSRLFFLEILRFKVVFTDIFQAVPMLSLAIACAVYESNLVSNYSQIYNRRGSYAAASVSDIQLYP